MITAIDADIKDVISYLNFLKTKYKVMLFDLKDGEDGITIYCESQTVFVYLSKRKMLRQCICNMSVYAGLLLFEFWEEDANGFDDDELVYTITVDINDYINWCKVNNIEYRCQYSVVVNKFGVKNIFEINNGSYTEEGVLFDMNKLKREFKRTYRENAEKIKKGNCQLQKLVYDIKVNIVKDCIETYKKYIGGINEFGGYSYESAELVIKNHIRIEFGKRSIPYNEEEVHALLVEQNLGLPIDTVKGFINEYIAANVPIHRNPYELYGFVDKSLKAAGYSYNICEVIDMIHQTGLRFSEIYCY